MNSVCILVCSALLVGTTFAEEKCSIVFPQKGAAFRPLLYNADETELLLENHEGAYKVPSGNSVIFTCKQHEITDETIHSVIAHCRNGQLVDENGQSVEPSEISCQLRVLELKPVLSTKCSGSLAKYQFHKPGSQDLSTVAETCYDIDRNIPVYSHYKVALPPQFLENEDLDPAPYMSAVDILSVYRSDEINKVVTKLLGEGHVRRENVLYTVSLIPKEHLHAQFKDVSRRAHNLITLWDNVLYGNFENLVQDIRKLRKHQRTLEVYSGVSQTPAQLTNSKGKLTDLYLKTRRTQRSFPIPEYYWAVVYERESQKAVAFIIRNDLEGSTTNMCRNVCEDLAWAENLKLNDNYKNAEIGQTTCCNIKEFLNVVKNVPALRDIATTVGDDGILKE
ncbi:uncharacterized protein LOC113375584 [Ctenocephalides felis]|uniref:uncharacterized protein LOC113362950 n=1 Tax=Ctenocephalides felis TaxID=7515 RepID=UPI000E6E4B65|nr:uncharacterized protein LOC113362950 [Ctenocephalides felis]XP_026471305.1 uncharacterized protein LOC113375584 [Ctenocephalides felis]